MISVHDAATNRGQVRSRQPDGPGCNGSPRVASDIGGLTATTPFRRLNLLSPAGSRTRSMICNGTRPASIEHSSLVRARASAMFCATMAFIACCAAGSPAPHQPASYRPADQDLASPKSLNRTRRVRWRSDGTGKRASLNAWIAQSQPHDGRIL